MKPTAPSSSSARLLQQVSGFSLALIPAIIFATAIFAKGLFQDYSIFHGDALIHGLPVMSFQSSVLNGANSMLWTDKLYMGYPVHAEGQFGFFSPLNVFASWFFSPEKAVNVLHWLSLILTAGGVIALCRSMRLSYSASAMASLIVAFSGVWLHSQHNVTISSALAWLPWVIWGYERWIRNPTHIAPLVVCVTIITLSGYPQLLHGAAVYLAVLFLHSLLAPSLRDDVIGKLPRLIPFGLAAILLCLGLTALQLLPLFELVSLSYRESGIDIFRESPLMNFLRGVPFYTPDNSPQYTHSFGSAALFLLLSALALARYDAKIVGHVIAALFLANLAVGHASPLMALIYKYHLLPGLHSFRIMHPYLALTIIGLAVVAGHVADSLARAAFTRVRLVVTLLVLWPIGFLLVRYLRLDDISVYQYWLLAAEAGLVTLILFTPWKRYLPQLFVAFLIVETATLKLENFHFFPNSVLDEPDTVAYIKGDDDFAEYKTHNQSQVGAYTFQSFTSKKVGEVATVLLHFVNPSSNLLWDLPSTSGAHALALRRSVLLQETITDEITKPSTGRAGLRLIDYYGIKYILAGKQPKGESITLAHTSSRSTAKVFENHAAYRRYQAFTSYEFARSPEGALARLKELDDIRLIVEPEGNELPVIEQAAAEGLQESGAISFSPSLSSPTEHRLVVDAAQEGWFFLADANYPGWKATLDGEEVPVFTAQVLGKAVWIPRGRHELRLWFSPISYKLGLAISSGTAGIAIIAFVYFRQRRHRRS